MMEFFGVLIRLRYSASLGRTVMATLTVFQIKVPIMAYPAVYHWIPMCRYEWSILDNAILDLH